MTALGRLEIGVVGCGQHSRYHLQHYGDFPAAEVVAVADVDRERARQVAGEFAVDITMATTASCSPVTSWTSSAWPCRRPATGQWP